MKQLLASPSLQLVTYPASATAQSAEFAISFLIFN
ncbi:hypothetical protein ACSLO1_24490, partial [Escherichia coli]